MNKSTKTRRSSSTRHEPRPEPPLKRLVASLALALLLIHAWHAVTVRSERLLLPHLVAWIQDVLMLVILTEAILLTGDFVRNASHLRRLVNIASIGILVSVATALSVYPAQLSNFLAFRVNVLRVDSQTSSFFFTEYLGWSILWHPLVFLVLTFALFRILPQGIASKRMRWVAFAFCVLGFVSLGRTSPQPFVYGLQETVKQWIFAGERVVPSLTRLTERHIAPPVDSSAFILIDTSASLRYRHVLLLVLESVNTSSFENEFLKRRGGYYEQMKHQSVYFSRYHATNLDSYTSLISMLTSVTVPYRAYTDATLYDGVNCAPNIVKSLRRRGLKTMFISTYEYQPFVPVRKDWDCIMDRRDLPSKENMVSVGTNRMEAATEDMVALSTIVNFVKSNERTFVLHELVYGHSPEWIMKTGFHQIEYYDRYIRALSNAIDSLGLAEQTLVFIVSDHGPREHSSDPQNYHIPLLITGASISGGIDSTFLSHRDLPSIINRFLVGGVLNPQVTPLYVVGSTEKWVYGEITPDDSYLFIDNESGTVLQSSGHLNPNSVQSGFQQVLDLFAVQYPLMNPATN